MSQAYEDSIQLFCVRCEDVGLYCNCTICGISEERVIDNIIVHMFEYHAIEPDEMTTCMRMKIEENHAYTTLPYLEVLAHLIVIFDQYSTCRNTAVLS
jgi:predicted small metal-binding protein